MWLARLGMREGRRRMWLVVGWRRDTYWVAVTGGLGSDAPRRVWVDCKRGWYRRDSLLMGGGKWRV